MTRHHWLLVGIVAAYVVLAVVYSLITPLFEASDELWHFPMVRQIATTGQLPVQDSAAPGLWRQEGSQPPLYYMAAALLTAGIDTSDLDLVRRVNPHADIGLVLPDGNVNMIVHRASAEAWPWQGTALAVHVARLFSVALGAGTVVVTWALGRRLFPERPEIALGAAALNAFLPMFLFLSGSVNNDNLSNLLGNLLTLQIVILLGVRAQPGWKLYAAIGLTAGAGLLAKFNIGFLLPVVALALVIVSLRLKSVRPLLVGGLITGGLTIGIAGWWYWRNIQLYGDPTGLNVFLELVGRRAIPANAAQLWAERDSFLQAFWGFFGGVNVPMPGFVYVWLNALAGLGLLGAAAFIIRTLARREWALERWLPALVTLLWPAITFLSYLSWTAVTPASQGRLVFAALSSILVWMVLGLTWWLPRRWRPIASSVVSAGFFMLAALVPFFVIAPAYTPPVLAANADEAQAVFVTADGPALALLEGGTDGRNVQPGDTVDLFTRWRAEEDLDRDWSLFVHLVTPDGVIIAQRDVYPGGGLLATSDLAPGVAWTNPIALTVPDTAPAPMTLTVEAGWYHLPSGERLTLADGAETVVLGEVDLQPRRSLHDVPNPVSVNFGGQMELIGYRVSDLSPAAGDRIELSLYWRGLQPMSEDYVVFAHILDRPTTAIFASSDSAPANWTRPTSGWATGEVITDTHMLTVSPDTPPGVYELEIGVYLNTGGQFERLRVHTADGGMAADYAVLTRMRVLPAPEVTEAAP